MTSTQIVLDRQQSREVDRLAMTALGMSSLVLMENAGRGVADTLGALCRETPPAGPVMICCGRGNNAGDGFVLARHLNIRDVPTAVLLLADPAALTGDAVINFDILAKTDVSITAFKTADDVGRLESRLAGAGWVVDALLGTGAHGNPRPPLDRAIEAMNRTAAPKLAIDLPSGLDCDTGHIATPTFRADHTCTFVAAKPGFFVPGAQQVTGNVHVLDIGIPPRLVRRLLDESRA